MIRRRSGLPVALVAVFYFLCGSVSAQAQWEVNMVRGINPINKNGAVQFISSSAEPLAVALPVGIFAVAMIHHDHAQKVNAYEMVAGLAITAAATLTLKEIVKRPRPYETYSDIYPDQPDKGYSFPSAHTAVSFSMATSLTLTYKKWYVAVPAYVWAASVGYSRIYLGQHYPSDVFAGAVTGTASALISHWLRRRMFERNKHGVKPINN